MTWDIWLVVGFFAQALFSLRFFVQWVASERKGESYVPDVFWYFSLAGGALLLVYAIRRRDPVFILGQASGLLVYLRNITLIRKRKARRGDAVPD